MFMRGNAVLTGALFLLLTSYCWADISPIVVQKAKNATARVEIESARTVQKVAAPQIPEPRNLAKYEILVSYLDSNDIRRFDARTGAYLGDFAVGNGLKGPQDMLWGPDGNLYVSCAYTQSVLRFNGKTGQFLGAFVTDRSGGHDDPCDMAWGPDGNLYVASHWTHEVKRYKGKTGAFLNDFIGGGNMVYPERMLYRPKPLQ